MPTSEYIHLARPQPNAGPANSSPLNVTIHPQVLFSILDHSMRSPANARVIGTLLGIRSEDGSEVEVKTSYAVPHTVYAEQIAVDMEYHQQMLALHTRANPREILVGWYATTNELFNFSALVQNFYAGQAPGDGTYPYAPVHLTLSTEPGKEIETQTYISVPIGVNEERHGDSCSFVPVPHKVLYTDADKSGLELISSAKDSESRSAMVGTDLDGLERSIMDVLEMVERVSNYVSNVLDEEAQPSSALGQYLMNTLSLAPKVDASTIERDFNNHIQDVLVVAYLANTIRTQIDLSNRLATAALTLGGEGGGERGEGGQKGDRRGGRNRNQNKNENQSKNENRGAAAAAAATSES